MTGDYTRFSFDPLKRYAGVLMQQGRVQLDADWNEEIDILRRRIGLLSLDTFGAVGVPYLTTPDAFLLGLIAGPPDNLSIEPGRLYVDGLLAEAFVEDKATYLSQPFYPDPPPLPGGDALAYLEIWEREVTYIEDPALLDAALGGVDTTTRLQTVWQLRVDAAQGAACGMPVGKPASQGRLTTQAIAPPTPDDPCILPPVAGYRGLENRLYRVEVQTAGPLGTARFKWSRDNATIVSAITGIAISGTQTTLTVNRIGRDGVMRFRIGDWVTVTDDQRELMGEAGEMALVVDIVEDQRQIILDRALPTGRPFGATAADLAARHTRIHRWDQTASTNAIDADGLIATATGPIDLEAGIQIAFSTLSPGGEFNLGDHWVFWARTATAQIEILNAAPPRGITRHYVQIAAITGLGGPTPAITDCRPPPPKTGGGDRRPGCCTIVVVPGESIQAAVDALPDVGGCVCVKAGTHAIDRPIIIQRDNVTLHGESMGAIIVNRRGTGILALGNPVATRVHTLVMRHIEASSAPLVMMKGGEDSRFDDCVLDQPERGDGVGFLAASADGLVISGCRFQSPAIGVWLSGGCRNVTVSGCQFSLSLQVEAVATAAAILASAMRGPLIAEDNLIVGTANGIIVNDAPGGDAPASRAIGSRIARNRIGLAVRGAQARTYAIDTAAAGSVVSENYIQMRGDMLTGVRLCGSGSAARGNTIASAAGTPAFTLAVSAGEMAGNKLLPLERIAVTDNVCEGSQHGALLLGVARPRVSGNSFGRAADITGFGVAMLRVTDAIVDGNILAQPFAGIYALQGARNHVGGNRIDGGQLGIVVATEEAPTISDNRITGAAQGGIRISDVSQRCAVIANRVIRCGAAAPIATGINAMTVAGELHLDTNEVMDTGLPRAAGAATAPLAYQINGENILEARIEGNQVTYSSLTDRPVTGDDRALRMRGLMEIVTMLGDTRAVFGFAIQIANNRFIGTGARALVEIWQTQINDLIFGRFERVLYSGNHHGHFSPPIGAAAAGATVTLTGRHCSIMGNHVKATTPFPSWSLNDMEGPFIGNASQSGNSRRAAQMPNPEAAFNTNPF
ncbi:DUF6519 domain-containing protein [Sphingomonas quercus]|uniref:Right-handed parallel beta-helix repeat-containing protein n=1 Tax=Sphingomonas quercus TaxID=2842451 RepID=A0ABS6BKZ5_9SPHN|nr:DUF6519 domain-containing protein [Sphingomonas quercus]MBU3078988.1 right-handed parallel beta-helix repeat-containing protein [Sphingomonas quercus]